MMFEKEGETECVRSLVLDFCLVSGVDASAVAVLRQVGMQRVR